MKPSDITNLIFEQVKRNGWQARIVSIDHVKDIEQEIETYHQNGLLDEELYDSYLDRFDFNLCKHFKEARSLIIVTAPQPQQQVTFNWRDQTVACIIPPTYDPTTDGRIKASLTEILKPHEYRLEKKRLPQKILSVRSGLARYGKNNITYVPGMGSFHRPVVFATDLPCEEDRWGESQPLKACSGCTACMEACPSGAIASDRFLVHAGRCITFHNERSPEFPQWLESSWHNSLVGCMHCQTACPINTKFIDWIEESVTFTRAETEFFLNGTDMHNLPRETLKKLEWIGMTEYATVLGRNLKALIDTLY